MPSTFPQCTFQDFGKLAVTFFPPLMSNENLNDSCQKLLHFQNAWQAVRYRYRTCSEQNETFKMLFTNSMDCDLWREWTEGEDHNFKLEQCLYNFFTNALSVFESLGFCLYFVGAMINAKNFPKVTSPKDITLKTTRTVFTKAFPNASVTVHLKELLENPDFMRIDEIRNIQAHRVIGRRNIRSFGTTLSDGKNTLKKEELWYLPGVKEKLTFNEELTQIHFNNISRMLKILVLASLEFVRLEKGEV